MSKSTCKRTCKARVFLALELPKHGYVAMGQFEKRFYDVYDINARLKEENWLSPITIAFTLREMSKGQIENTKNATK